MTILGFRDVITFVSATTLHTKNDIMRVLTETCKNSINTFS